MARSLVLDSLEIESFRAFRQLQIDRLGRVNLITGKNNVGKTCLLEALWLYASRGSPSNIVQLLDMRDERSYSSVRGVLDETVEQEMAIRYLFHGREEAQKPRRVIRIGPKDRTADRLALSLKWSALSTGEGGRRELEILEPDEYDTGENPIAVLVVEFGREERAVHRLDRDLGRRGFRFAEKTTGDEIPCVFTPANGLNAQQIGQLWDAVALTDKEENVMASLRIIASDVDRVNLIGGQQLHQRRIPVVRLSSLVTPIPLGSMGEGMNRLFGLALALVNAQDGILLIDEIDSGLHYSVQPEMWRLIVEVARRLRIQVFATTHSWDCIEALQKAIQKHSDRDGMLISLRDKKGRPGHVVAVLFDESELAIVTREDIEVR